MTHCRCRLDPAALAERMRAFSDVLSGAPGATRALPGGRWRMTLDLPAEGHDRLVALVAAEADCCPWMELTARRTPAGQTILEGVDGVL